MMKKNSFVVVNRRSMLFKAIAIVAIMFFQSLLFPIGTYAQNQKVTFNKNNVTVNEVLNSIKQQTSLSLVFDVEDVDLNRKVNINATGKDLKSVLDALFNGTGISFVINDTHIVLTKEKSATAPQATNATFTLKGVVKDVAGLAMIGVTVVDPTTQNGTTTGADGSFTLQVKGGEKLIFSYIGYQNKEVIVNRSVTLLSVVLAEDVTTLDEVVVTALGIKRKTKALGYNVQEVVASELTTVKDANFMNSLAGKVAGLSVNSSTGVGAATKVVMRGSKSLTKDNNALYVIDGVPIINSRGDKVEGAFSNIASGEGISDINPEDIESMSVLTGPSAAALYGSYAANGAILITTKKGTEGKVKVTVSNNTDFSTPFISPRFQNTYGNNVGEFSSWGTKLDTPSSYDPMDFFQTGFNLTNAVTVSTGTAKNQTFASAASTNAAGIMPNNEYNRYNFTVRNTTKMMNDKMTLDLGASFIMQDDKNMPGQGQYFNGLIPVYLFPRGESFDNVRLYEYLDEGTGQMTQYWPYGNEGIGMQNPYWGAYRNLFMNEKDRYMFNAGLKYDIAEWINVSGRVRVDNSSTVHKKKLFAGTDGMYSQDRGYYASHTTSDKQVYADALVNINKTICDFSIAANIGASIFDIRNNREGMKGQLNKEYNQFTFHNIKDGATNTGVIQEGYREQIQSIFASAEFGYKSMLYLTVTGRNDWSSALAATNTKSFFYPSVSLSGVISEMFELPKFISFMKIRAAYSDVGSAPPRHLTIPTYQWTPQGTTTTTSQYPISELKPESTKSYEVGLNVKMFESALNFDVSWYTSNTYNQTFTINLSPSTGYSKMIVQGGDVENWGIEAALGYKMQTKDFSWDTNLTYSMNRNTIKKLVRNQYDIVNNVPLNFSQLDLMTMGTYKVILEEGGSIGDFYTTTELKEDNQGMIYVDPNTGLLTTVDNFQKVGRATPDCNIGFRNNFKYKNFNLGFLVTARIGGQVASVTEAYLDRYGVSERSAIARDNGGVPVNYGKMDARYFYEYVGGGQTGMLNRYIYDATNVRLQELNFGYTLPSKWFNDKLTMNVSFVGRNLWMIYNKAPFDPELTANTSGTFYQGVDYFMQPSVRNLGFSVKLQF